MSNAVIKSLLDTDLYKLTMQAAVLVNFPDAVVEYKFTNRTPNKKLNSEAVKWLKEQLEYFGELSLSEEELDYLRTSLPYLPSIYFEFLSELKLKPKEQVCIIFDPTTDEIDIKVKGLWKETILYEVPILALVSEAYFKFVETDWTYDGQFETAVSKTQRLIDSGCSFSEFGTRRRRSFRTQELVIAGIVEGSRHSANPALLAGTSNVHFARLNNLKPIGTVAHEWMMGIAAITQDYEKANKLSMELWLKAVGNKSAGVALTDTFGTESFLRVFTPPLSDIYDGVRQDSGDPLEYTKLLAAHYRKLGYPPKSKRIVFSDSLDIDKCILYKSVAESEGFNVSFGIGTYFTNLPHEKSTPLNIVIKLSKANGNPAIKISDNLGKNMGDPDVVKKVKQVLGYIEKDWTEGDESSRWDDSPST